MKKNKKNLASREMTSFSSRLFALFFLTSLAFATSSPQECPDGVRHYRASIRHIEKGGIGYDQGYTTIEAFFAPDPQQLAVMPFLDLRGHVFDNGNMAANAGLGIRKLLGCRTYGGNAYYDYRNTNKLHYNQVGVGFETLGALWDLRINGYLPVGKKLTSPYNIQFDRFSGHEMILSQKYQFAMKGVDGEVGFHFGKTPSFDFYGAIGPYYFIGPIGPNTWGGKARLGGTYKEYVRIELSDSYDKMFYNNFQGQLTLTLPFGKASKVKKTSSLSSCKMANTLVARMVQPVEREEIIVVGKEKQSAVAINPATGQPYYFVFVDNTSSSNGTYESPYHTLAQAEANSGPGQIIYVFPGNGTTSGMDAGITLQEDQYFWGSGVTHPINTAQGTVYIPPQSSSSPQMTNTTGDGITVASSNQISGFTLTGVAGNGIAGTSAENIQISSCTIDGSETDHINLLYGSATGNLNLTELMLINGTFRAIVIDSNASSMTCTVSNCTIQDNGAAAIDSTFANQGFFSLTHNIIQRNDSSSSINFTGPATLLSSGNTFQNNTSVSDVPLSISAGTSPFSAIIKNNKFIDNVSGAIRLTLSDTELATITISGNTITGNGTGSISSLGAPLFINPNSTTSGNLNLTLTNNTFSENVGSALYASNGSFNNFQVTATSNKITNSGGGGFIFANDYTTLTLNAAHNTISEGSDHGIATGSTSIETATITLSNNTITGNGNSSNGVVISHSGTDLTFVATNNEISNNAGSGITFYSAGLIDNISITIENNTISNNQNAGSNASGGVGIEQYATLSGTLKNNTFANNTSGDVFIGSTDTAPSVCLEMSGNNADTGYTLQSGTGTFNLTPCNAATVNEGTITELGTITPVQSCPGAAPCVVSPSFACPSCSL